jgi:hypothetical protein
MRHLRPLGFCFLCWMRRGLLGLGIVGVLVIVCGNASGQDGPSGTSLQKWGYCLIDSIAKQSQRESLERSSKNLNVLSITGYRLAKDGRIHSPSHQIQKEIASLAAKSGLELLPLVGFKSSSEGRILLASPFAREKAKGELVELARSGVYAGLHLDL